MRIDRSLHCWIEEKFELDGDDIIVSEKRIESLQKVYKYEIRDDYKEMLAYKVKIQNTKVNVVGSLQFGVSYVYPYQIQGEFSCTKGHFHADRNYDEYYFGYEGEGFLLLWDGEQEWFAQRVYPGSVHYINGKYAHRLINTSKDKVLKVGACWSGLAGYDYQSIEENGFPVRCFEKDGNVEWIDN